MSIEFHCSQCGKVITAPKESAGKRGKCPHCQNVCYIPSPPEDGEEYNLAPLDGAEEERRAREDAEAAAMKRSLLHERLEVEGPDAPEVHSDDDMVRPADLRGLISDYIAAMGRGHLDEAERLAFALAKNKKEVLATIDRIGADDVAAASLSKLPRPVMLGFLRQLRSKMQ